MNSNQLPSVLLKFMLPLLASSGCAIETAAPDQGSLLADAEAADVAASDAEARAPGGAFATPARAEQLPALRQVGAFVDTELARNGLVSIQGASSSRIRSVYFEGRSIPCGPDNRCSEALGDFRPPVEQVSQAQIGARTE